MAVESIAVLNNKADLKHGIDCMAFSCGGCADHPDLEDKSSPRDSQESTLGANLWAPFPFP
jgi:hypothetical protein